MSKQRHLALIKEITKSPKSPEKLSPSNGRLTRQRGRTMVSNLGLQGAYLSKQLSAEIEQKNQIISCLREQNLSLHNEVKTIKGKRKKLNKIAQSFNTSPKHMLIEDDSLEELDEINVIMDICQKLEGVLDEKTTKDLATLANISRDFSIILKNGPNSSKKIEESLKSLEETINKLVLNYFQEELSKNLTIFKQTFKRQRESLKAELQETINTNIKIIQQKQQDILKKQLQILDQLPNSLKQLKQVSKKREEDHKKQVTFLQKKIIAMNEEYRRTIDSQNNLIQQLREGLSKLKEVYNKQIQIPLLSIRQKVEKEINNIKAEFVNMRESTTLSVLISDLIESLKRYTQSKNMANNEQMRDEIKKTNEKLSLLNEKSLETISKVRQIIKSSSHITFDYEFMSKAHKKEEQLANIKRDSEELCAQARYQKQKEYIEMLEKYNKKLEQSVMRTQKEHGKHLYNQWKAIQGQYRTKQRQFIRKLDFIQSEVTTSKAEIIQIKKTAMAILQTEKSLATLFQSFEAEIASIKSFKDQLFNFLENQLKFRQQINRQVQLFNSMFVDKYSKLSQLQSIIPPMPEQSIFANHDQFCTAIADSISNYKQFKQDYEGVFKCKTNIDIKFHKYYTSIAQLQEQYSKIVKNKTNNFILELNFQPLKTHINTAIYKVQDLLNNNRVFRQAILKNFSNIKSDLNKNNQQFQKIFKFIKQSKFMDTIRLASQLLDSKNRILREVQQLLCQFTGLRQQVDPVQHSLFSSDA